MYASVCVTGPFFAAFLWFALAGRRQVTLIIADHCFERIPCCNAAQHERREEPGDLRTVSRLRTKALLQMETEELVGKTKAKKKSL